MAQGRFQTTAGISTAGTTVYNPLPESSPVESRQGASEQGRVSEADLCFISVWDSLINNEIREVQTITVMTPRVRIDKVQTDKVPDRQDRQGARQTRHQTDKV